MVLWGQNLDRLVSDRYGQQVPQGWRDQVVGLAASGRQDEAFEQARQELLNAGDPYSIGVENGRAPEFLRESYEPGIRAWLDRQVEADQAKGGDSAPQSAKLTWLEDATPPLTSAKPLDPGAATRPESASRPSGPGRASGQTGQAY